VTRQGWCHRGGAGTRRPPDLPPRAACLALSRPPLPAAACAVLAAAARHWRSERPPRRGACGPSGRRGARVRGEARRLSRVRVRDIRSRRGPGLGRLGSRRPRRAGLARACAWRRLGCQAAGIVAVARRQLVPLATPGRDPAQGSIILLLGRNNHLDRCWGGHGVAAAASIFTARVLAGEDLPAPC
jgi:hypothetical protein